MLEHILQPVADYFLNLGLTGIAILSVMEAMFFPLPPDVVLFACALLKPHSIWAYAFVATIASTCGAATNYFIGLKGGRKFFQFVFKDQQDQLEKIEKLYQEYGILTVFVVAFTPIPFMVFTMASGIFKLNFLPFIVTCFVGRMFRFFTFSSLVVFFGAQIKNNIELFFFLVALLIIVAYFGADRVKKLFAR